MPTCNSSFWQSLANEMGTESYSDDSHAKIHPDDYKMSIAPDGHPTTLITWFK